MDSLLFNCLMFNNKGWRYCGRHWTPRVRLDGRVWRPDEGLDGQPIREEEHADARALLQQIVQAKYVVCNDGQRGFLRDSSTLLWSTRLQSVVGRPQKRKNFLKKVLQLFSWNKLTFFRDNVNRLGARGMHLDTTSTWVTPTSSSCLQSWTALTLSRTFQNSANIPGLSETISIQVCRICHGPVEPNGLSL